MATFSVNQVRQLYVAKELKTPNVIETDNAGAIAVKKTPDKKCIYFEYMGAGGMTRSDLIDISSITHAKSTDASNMAHKLAKYEVVLAQDINSGAPVAGQDYILRIHFNNYIGLSEEDQYIKLAMVHSVAGMTASDFYKELAISLAINFSAEESTLLKFYLKTASSTVEVTKQTKESTLTGTYTGVVIEEAPQDWVLGTFEQTPVNFTILPSSIIFNGDDRIWGTVTKVNSTNTIKNGHKIADLEYFCMGERGDVYRGVGFPNIIRTNYLVDPNQEYNTIDIHYAYQGSNEAVQKSEKDLTIVIPKVGATNAVANKLTNDIISAIGSTLSGTGYTFPDLVGLPTT